MDRFIILGAGVTGVTAACELSSLGAEVTVVEKTSFVGGNITASSYCCKATSSCARCGVCIAHTGFHSVLHNPRITLHTGSIIERFSTTPAGISARIARRGPSIDYHACSSCNACIEACPDKCITRYKRGEITQYVIDYDSCRMSTGGDCDACEKACPSNALSCTRGTAPVALLADRMLVATGHQPFSARRKPRYSYESAKKVMTGLEAETVLSSRTNFGDSRERVGIIQCVGSRDASINRNFCSGVCCAYALRIARMLRYRNPEMEVTLFYIDLQNFDREFNNLLDETRRLGVAFVRGIPFRIDEEADGHLAVSLESPDGAENKAYFDRIILSVGIDSRDDAGSVAETIGLSRDAYGFLASDDPRIVTCGTCSTPMSIPECISAAKRAAHDLWSGGTT